MFQFRRFPTHTYFIQRTLYEYGSYGFPHSDIPGSSDICSSPRLFAACHVLLRLLMPRHSPCALIRLTSSSRIPLSLASCFRFTLPSSSAIPWFSLELCKYSFLQKFLEIAYYPNSFKLKSFLSISSLLLRFSIVQFSKCNTQRILLYPLN